MKWKWVFEHFPDLCITVWHPSPPPLGVEYFPLHFCYKNYEIFRYQPKYFLLWSLFYLFFTQVRWLPLVRLCIAQFKSLWYLGYSARITFDCFVLCKYSGNRQILMTWPLKCVQNFTIDHLHYPYSSTSSHNFTCTIAVVHFHLCSSTPILKSVVKVIF